MYLVFVDEVEAEAEAEAEVVEAVALVRFQDSLLAWRLEHVAKLILIFINCISFFPTSIMIIYT